MKNFIQRGNTITVTAPYAVSSGDGVLVGSLFGVAAFDALITTSVEIVTEGVFDLAKTSALAIGVGDVVYWDDAAKEVNKTTSGTPVGVALVAAANPSATVTVRLFSGYNPPLDGSLIRYRKVDVANADVKKLFGTGTEIIPAPGDGKVIEVVEAVLVNHYSAAAFTAGGALQLSYGSGVTIPATATVAATFLTSPAASQVIKVAGALASNLLSAINNTAVTLACATQEFATGGGSLTVLVAYRVHTT